MEKKKYQVFISSTYKDLLDERQAAVEAVLKAGHIPAGMELFRSGKKQLETIKKWIDESDIYVLILGRRYGTVENNSKFSYTELEYRYALEERKMPGFAIVMNDDWANGKISLGVEPENVFEIENKQSFESFFEFVKTKIVSFASNPAEIKLAIHENLHELGECAELVGWIRSNVILSEEKLTLLIELQEENKSLQETVNRLKKEKTILIPENLVDISTKIEIHCVYRFNGDKRKKIVEVTWENIFIQLAPELISYLSESQVITIIEDYLFDKSGLALDNITSKHIIKEDFFTIRTQLIAYGLVEVQNLKTINGGTSLFWLLTQSGKQKMFELKTIRNDQ